MSTAPNLIELIDREQPNTLTYLKENHPSEEKLFSHVLAAKADSLEPALSSEKRAAFVDLLSKSMTLCATDLDGLAKKIRETMKRVSAIKYAGSLIATVSGGLAGILIVVLDSEPHFDKWIKAIVAFAGMLGGIAAVTADQFERAPSGIRIASADEYGKLIEMRSNIEVVRLKIERDDVVPISDSDLQQMLSELDEYAKSIIRLKLA